MNKEELLEIIRKDIHENDSVIYNEMSNADREEIMFAFCPNDLFEQILSRLWETWGVLDNEGLEAIIENWDAWANKKDLN